MRMELKGMKSSMSICKLTKWGKSHLLERGVMLHINVQTFFLCSLSLSLSLHGAQLLSLSISLHGAQLLSWYIAITLGIERLLVTDSPSAGALSCVLKKDTLYHSYKF